MSATPRSELVDKVHAAKVGALWTPLKVPEWEGFVRDVHYTLVDLRTQGYISIQSHPDNQRQPWISSVGHIWFPERTIPKKLNLPFYSHVHEVDGDSKITRMRRRNREVMLDESTDFLRGDAPRLFALMTTVFEEFPMLQEQVEQIQESLFRTAYNHR